MTAAIIIVIIVGFGLSFFCGYLVGRLVQMGKNLERTKRIKDGLE
ncbi:MAG TPA: hypothetical protein VL832_11440 [Puia sp.]|jgi:hypothetical protein|nr:hypothetical protein [Puia sp.]